MPGGRPSSYKPDYCDVAIEMGREGETYTAIAATIGVTRETLYSWMRKNDEFLDAMKTSRSLAAMWWERTLRRQATDGKGSATAAIFAMKNQFPDDYKDRHEHKVEAEVGVFEIDFTGFDEDTE